MLPWKRGCTNAVGGARRRAGLVRAIAAIAAIATRATVVMRARATVVIAIRTTRRGRISAIRIKETKCMVLLIVKFD